jgi:hypothetical protein
MRRIIVGWKAGRGVVQGSSQVQVNAENKRKKSTLKIEPNVLFLAAN